MTANGLFSRDRASLSPLQIVSELDPKTAYLAKHSVRCGKANCRCASGNRHVSWRLVWWEFGRKRHRYVRQSDLDAVQSAIDEVNRRRMLSRLRLADALSGLKSMRELLRDLQCQ